MNGVVENVDQYTNIVEPKPSNDLELPIKPAGHAKGPMDFYAEYNFDASEPAQWLGVISQFLSGSDLKIAIVMLGWIGSRIVSTQFQGLYSLIGVVVVAALICYLAAGSPRKK